VSAADVHDWLKEKPEEIRNIYEEVGETVLDAVRTQRFNSMYECYYHPLELLFCRLADIAKKSNKMLIIHDSAWTSLGKNRQIEILDFSVSLKKPCCVHHAMELLTQKFVDRCEDLYGEQPDLRQNYLEDIEVSRVTEEALHIEFYCGT
tara:strand:+ start:104 stop:550 length:447 start_codon:yes stop_codon:yes gene_type:complete